MKPLLYLLFFLIPLFITAQERDLENKILSLKTKIQQSENEEKLKWLDSLSNIIAYDTSFENDSIVLRTRNFAIELDSFNIAIHHTANLIYFQNNIKGAPQKGKELYLQNRKFLPKVTNNIAKCKFYYDAASSLFYLSEFDESLQLFDSVYYWAEKENNSKYIGRSKLGKGQVFTDMGDFGNASITLQDAIRFFQKIKDTSSLNDTRNSLAILYSKNQFYKEAKAERDEIIKQSLATKNYDNLPSFYYNAAGDEKNIGNRKGQIKYLNLALESSRKSRYIAYYEPIMLAGLIKAYAEADSISLAEKYRVQIEKDKEKSTTGPYRSYYLDAMKSLAFAKRNYSDALLYGEEYLSLMKDAKQYGEIESGEHFLSKVYQTTGNTEKAFQHYKNYATLKDSVENTQKVRVLSYYQTLYETEKRDLKIEAQESNIALLDSKNKLQNQWLFFGGLGLISLFGFVVLVRSRNTAKKRQVQQEKFTNQLVNTQEKERSRVAKELHDSVGQKLLILKNTLFLNKIIKKEEGELLDETIKEVREMSHSLHPFQFEKVGLVNSLEDMVSAFQKSSEVFYSSEIEDVSGLIPKEKEIFIFRMLQECINNVEKHSGATACNLSVFEENKQVVFQLKDNGKGFDVSLQKEKNESLGMKTLEERARFIEAYFSITSKIKKGTQVSIKIDKI